MAYLASTNTYFNARSGPKPIQYTYLQSTQSATSNGYIATPKSIFTFDPPSSCNVVDNLFTSDTNNTYIKFPSTGIWSLSWSMAFNASCLDNCAWFEVVNSKVYTALPGGLRRMSLSGNTGFYLAVAFTGYFNAGDIVALKVYTTVCYYLKATNAGHGLTVTLLQRIAPSIPAIPLPPPVIVS